MNNVMINQLNSSRFSLSLVEQDEHIGILYFKGNHKLLEQELIDVIEVYKLYNKAYDENKIIELYLKLKELSFLDVIKEVHIVEFKVDKLIYF